MEASCYQVKKSSSRQVEKERYLAANKKIEGASKKYSPQAIIEGSRVLPFSHIEDDVIIWKGYFPEQVLSVKVKGAVTRPKTLLEMALRHSKAVLGNIIPDRELAFAAAWDNEVSWLASLDQGRVEVIVMDIEDLSKTVLEDIFKDSLAVISQKEIDGKVAAQTREVFVKINDPGATSFVKGAVVSWEEFEKEDQKVRDRGEKPASIEIVKEPPPGNGNGDKHLPATNPGEPIPEKYRPLIPFIDEPLPPGTDFLVPAVVAEEGERKIDAVMRQLKDGVEGIQDSSHFRLFLTTMSKFHNYSLGNQILIMLQKPAATRVAGFQTWKNLGRWVNKGESGIAILAPVMPPKEKQERKEGEEEEDELAPTPVYFKVVHVFDIGQTTGTPLPEFDVPVLTGEANEELFAKALALAKAQGLEMGFEPRPQQDPSIKGQYSGKTIWVKGDEPRAQQLKSLLHEMAHYYSEGVFRIPRRDAETIAESAAFTVGAHFGFDSGIRSFPYVAFWAQDKKVLQANLAYIRKVATVMLEGLEKSAGSKEKLVPALKPFEPYHFAEYVLRYNRFSDAEIPIYSGLTGRNPLRVPDRIWREVIEGTDGEFVKQGELNVFHIPEKERPSYMRAAPTWRDVASTSLQTAPATRKKDFISQGDRVRLLLGRVGKFRYGHWPEDVWLGDKVVEGTVVEFYSEEPAVRVGGEYFEKLDAWALVKWDNGADTAIMAEGEGKKWERVKGSIPCAMPSPKDEAEFISDTPELIPFTIDDIGYRDKLDSAFEMAIARAKES